MLCLNKNVNLKQKMMYLTKKGSSANVKFNEEFQTTKDRTMKEYGFKIRYLNRLQRQMNDGFELQTIVELQEAVDAEIADLELAEDVKFKDLTSRLEKKGLLKRSDQLVKTIRRQVSTMKIQSDYKDNLSDW